MRFSALRAAIVSIVQSRSMQQPKIDRFFDRARKKRLGKELGALWGTIVDMVNRNRWGKRVIWDDIRLT